MRRVSKAKAAAMEVEGKKRTPKRSASKNASYAADAGSDADADAEEQNEVVPETEPAASSAMEGTKNGKATAAPGDDESDDAEAFEVEAILSSRVRHGKQQFKIRWKGYGPADDTWEDEENVDSPDLIAAFLRGTPEGAKAQKVPKSPKKGAKKRGGAASPKVKPAKKPKPENGDDNTEWEVSKIVDYVELKDGTRQFLVRWKGFSSKENTWEPEENLNCADLIEKFLALEKERDTTTRETREVRRPVHKYNPELTKRSSHRVSSKKRISYHDLE